MNDEQLLRYSRHILLREISLEGQQRILDGHVLLIGAGGLGSPIALYLAASGVGTLTVCDGDTVDITNLQRQIVHREQAVGQNKAMSAATTLASVNPQTQVEVVAQRLAGEQLAAYIAAADVVVDASDNFATRHAINRACVKYAKPLVSGAAVRFDGQVTVFDLRHPDSPCYACLYPEQDGADEERCADNGVFSPLVGIIGAVQAAEALKLLSGAGQTLNGRLMLLDALGMQWRTVRLKQDAACPVCSAVLESPA
jgi:molybdopterin/thiamine biosynthesis adenylyltransferase